MGDLGRAPEKASISLMVGAAYPRADEQDAERAMRVGLALVEVVAALDTAAGAEPGIGKSRRVRP